MNGRTPQTRQKEKMKIYPKIGLIVGISLAMCTAQAFAQLPGMPYMPYVIPVTIPATITLGQNAKYMVASIYDTDYLPYTKPTAVAATGAKAADGTAESTVINVQGSISTTGITVYIPVTATGSGTLAAYSTTITVPAAMTEDGISRDLTLSWAAQAYTISTTYITTMLAAVGGTLNAKKLDINGGIGNNYLGISLGAFSYPYNNAGNTTTFSVRDIAGIPDKKFGQADNSGSTTHHNMLYLPVIGEDGKMWLNNNLGADYANLNNASFNLVQQATTYDDYHAYGSLLQWGRKPDGHELMNWTASEAGTAVYGPTSTLVDEPANSLFVTSTTSDWRVNSVNDLWANEASANNPCPTGYRVPTITELSTLFTAAGITNYTTAFSSKLILTATGDHKFDDVIEFRYSGNRFTYYWTSTPYGTEIRTRFLTNTATSITNAPRTYGFPVRCIGN